VITNALFHPRDCNVVAYASSRGTVYVADMRDAATCDSKTTLFEDTDVQARAPQGGVLCSR